MSGPGATLASQPGGGAWAGRGAGLPRAPQPPACAPARAAPAAAGCSLLGARLLAGRVAAARARLDTMNMDFNKLTNQIKELRKAS